MVAHLSIMGLESLTNQLEIVKVLLEAGADVIKTDNSGHTPLYLVSSRRYKSDNCRRSWFSIRKQHCEIVKSDQASLTVEEIKEIFNWNQSLLVNQQI